MSMPMTPLSVSGDDADVGVPCAVIDGLEVRPDNVGELVDEGRLVLDGLAPRERDVVLQVAEVARRRADAVVTGVVESARRTGSYACDGHTSERTWAKALCRWSNRQAHVQASVARLIGAHGRCRAEYLAGRLGLAQIVELARLAEHPRAGVHFAGSEALLVEDAQRLCYEDFKAVCARWLLLADVDGADHDERLRHYLRNGCVITTDDGMVHLDAQFAAAQGVVINEIFDRFYSAETAADFDAARAERARRGEHGRIGLGDLARTDEQRRADALHTIFLRAGSTPPGSQPPEPVVDIIVDQDTLETLIDQLYGDGSPIDPASYRQRHCETTDGTVPSPSDVIAALLIGHVRRVVVEGASTVIDLGRRRRLFTGSARRAAQLRAPRCTYRGCGVPTNHCQTDHVARRPRHLAHHPPRRHRDHRHLRRRRRANGFSRLIVSAGDRDELGLHADGLRLRDRIRDAARP